MENKQNKTTYTYTGDFALDIIYDFIGIRLKYGKDYLEYLNKFDFEKLPINSDKIEILKQLLQSDFRVNKITKNITLKLTNNKLTIKY